MRSHPLSGVVQEQGLDTLGVLTLIGGTPVHTALSQGGVAALVVGVMEGHRPNSEIIFYALQVAWNLSCGGVELIRDMLEAGMAQITVGVMKEHRQGTPVGKSSPNTSVSSYF